MFSNFARQSGEKPQDRMTMHKRPCLWPGLLLLAVPVGTAAPFQPEASLQWMRETLPETPSWTEWQRRTGELPPDFDRLPSHNRLPDPLLFTDGRRVADAADWDERRSEILRLFERYVTGSFPPKPALNEVIVLEETDEDGYIIRDVRLDFGGDRPASVRVRVTMPDGDGPFPVVVAPGLAGWAPRLLRRGYVSVGYAGSDRADDAEALADIYPEHDFATLPRRAWLARLVIDYIETIPEVNKKQIAMCGYSRDGKMAAIASALDPRISALMAGSTGVGGFLPWRLSGERGNGEGIETTTRMFPSWFIPRLRFFSGREDRLPVDGNLLLALSAPRPVLLEYGLNDEVSNIWGIEQSYESARSVYQLLGRPDGLSLLRSPGFHGGIDPEACLDWLDGVFGRSSRPWVNDRLYDWDFAKWKARAVEKSGLAAFPEESKASTGAGDWETKRQYISKAMTWMLGEQPPRIPTTGKAAAPSPYPRRPPPPGPTEVAKGGVGNPGQLAPDVPAWVIGRGGLEFGWLEPQKNEVESRRIRFGSNVEGHLYYPAGTPEDAKLPAVIWLHGHSYPLGYMWVYRRDLHPILALAEAGYAVFAYDQIGFGSRSKEARTFYDRHPDWSLMGRMVEDARAAIDALEEEPLVDAQRISLFGYTLGGSVGLYTAALDSRVQGVVSICGFTPMRSDTSERGLTGLERYYLDRGLLPRLGLYAGGQERLPYDYDDVLSLIAPRPVLVAQPRRDRDASPEDVRAAVDRAREVFQLQGAASKVELFEPDDYARLTTATQNRIIEWMRSNLQPRRSSP